jgi:TrmH family RNA methyltransferase
VEERTHRASDDLRVPQVNGARHGSDRRRTECGGRADDRADVAGVLDGVEDDEPDRGAGLEGRELAARGRGTDVLEVDDREFASAAETDSPQGILAVGEIPLGDLASLEPGDAIRLVVLDAVQDPGNVGTIVRTAAALGATAVVAMPGTVDLWNAKVVRSAMGALFHRPAFMSTWAELDGFRSRHGVHVWAADAGGHPLGAREAPPRLALVVGNEGAGLSIEARERAESVVSLPIDPVVESLNVAVATGILLHQLRQ